MPRRDALHLYRPAAGPAAPRFGVLTLSHKRLSLSDIQELASKSRLHTTDDDISSYSSVTQRRLRQGLTNPTLWGELLAC